MKTVNEVVGGNLFGEEWNFVVNAQGVLTKYTGRGGVVVIPETVGGVRVTSIGESAFYHCSLTRVVIPKSVVRIEWGAFEGCSVRSIAFPKSMNRAEREKACYPLIAENKRTCAEIAAEKNRPRSLEDLYDLCDAYGLAPYEVECEGRDVYALCDAYGIAPGAVGVFDFDFDVDTCKAACRV